MRALLKRSVISGLIASVVMMPFGALFRMFDMRVGFYGPKFAGLFIDNPPPPFVFAQHFVLGIISAIPLLLVLNANSATSTRLVLGLAYGVGYYVLVNSLALPLYFGDPLPWSLGIATIIPSLVVHIVYGVAVALADPRFGR